MLQRLVEEDQGGVQPLEGLCTVLSEAGVDRPEGDGIERSMAAVSPACSVLPVSHICMSDAMLIGGCQSFVTKAQLISSVAIIGGNSLFRTVADVR